MSTPYFNQDRTVDPYSSYSSSVINKMHRMTTRGVDCLHSARSMDIETSDSTSVIMIPGFLYKSDLSIENTSNFTIDFSDSDMYWSFGAGFNESGYYAITIDYEWAVARPPIQAKIRIFKPSQRASITSRFFFLKSVYVVYNGSTFEIDSVHDFDSSYPLQKRIYSQIYLGTEDTRPTFDQSRDEARIIYVRDEDEVYFGASQDWINIKSIRDSIDTSNCTLKQLGYVHTDGKVHPAIASSITSFADCVVTGVGTVADGDGKVKLYGRVDNIAVETGRTVTPGENVYLSKIEAGKVTDLIPEPYSQNIGTCVAAGDSTSTCSIWFMPGSTSASGEFGQSLYDRYQDLLLGSIYKRLTVDSFVNVDRIDLINSTTTLDTINYEIDGDAGETFRTTNLVEAAYDGTCIVSCQITAETTGDDLTWYASNNGNSEWEEAELDDIHIFATHTIPIDSTGTFIIGEVIVGNASAVTAIINGNYGSYISFRSLTGTGSFINGETITGQTSGITKTVGVQSARDVGYDDVRVRCDFGSSGTIDDYGILYDQDETIVPSDFESNERNIETLYSDIYTSPSIDNDGNPNLTTPIETCKNNIRSFIGSDSDYQVIPPYSSTNIIDATASITLAISQLDEGIESSSDETGYLRDFIGKSNEGPETPYYSSHTVVDSTANLEIAISQLDAAVASAGSITSISLTNTQRIITDGDTTPSILDGAGNRCGLLRTNNSGATTITNFDDFVEQTTFSLYFNDNNTTIQSNPNILLQGDADFEGKLYDIITFRKLPNGWLEIARRTGSGSINVTGYGTFGLNDTTPDITGYKNWYTNNDSTSIVTITNLQNGREGDEVTIIFEDANTTIASNASIILNSSGSGFNGNINDTITLVYTAGIWYEKSRASAGSSTWSTYLHNQAIAGDPWNINHGLGQKICHVTVADAANNVIIPNNILFSDVNNLVITFLANTAGSARISK